MAVAARHLGRRRVRRDRRVGVEVAAELRRVRVVVDERVLRQRQMHALREELLVARRDAAEADGGHDRRATTTWLLDERDRALRVDEAAVVVVLALALVGDREDRAVGVERHHVRARADRERHLERRRDAGLRGRVVVHLAVVGLLGGGVRADGDGDFAEFGAADRDVGQHRTVVLDLERLGGRRRRRVVDDAHDALLGDGVGELRDRVPRGLLGVAHAERRADVVTRRAARAKHRGHQIHILRHGPAPAQTGG